MEDVGAALGDHDHLRSSSQAETLTATRVVGFHGEFLDALYGCRDRALWPSVERFPIVGVAGSGICDLPAIQEERILIAAGPSDLAAETARLRTELLRHRERL